MAAANRKTKSKRKRSEGGGLGLRMSVLENTVILQNTVTNKSLESQARVLKEIHDKQDAHIVDFAAKFAAVAEVTDSNKSKINNLIGYAVAISVTIVGGILLAKYF